MITPPSPSHQLSILQGNTLNPDAAQAVKEIAAQISQPNIKLCLVFFSDSYDHASLIQAFSENFHVPVIGCTTAGQLSALGFQKGGISGITIAGDQFNAFPYLIHPLESLAGHSDNILQKIQKVHLNAQMKSFGLILVDGLAEKEELLTATLYRSLGEVPIIGGSAGDMLKFQNTYVYYNGQFFSNAAIFILCQTSLPFIAFKHQHFHPTEKRLVITEAKPEQRLVLEINGIRAVDEYAAIIGVPVDQLNATIFSKHPLMLRIGSDYFVRSISEVKEDGSLKFYCAIDRGLVLTVGEGVNPYEDFAKQIEFVKQKMAVLPR